MRIGGVASRGLFGGTAARPLAIVRVTLVNDGPGGTGQAGPTAPGPVTVRVAGPAVATPQPALAAAPGPGEQAEGEVGVAAATPYATGSPRQVTVIAQATGPPRPPPAAFRGARAPPITPPQPPELLPPARP